MVYKFNDYFEIYFEEYVSLLLDFSEKQSKEIQHRRKILKDWIDNEIQLWENTENVLN